MARDVLTQSAYSESSLPSVRTGSGSPADRTSDLAGLPADLPAASRLRRVHAGVPGHHPGDPARRTRLHPRAEPVLRPGNPAQPAARRCIKSRCGAVDGRRWKHSRPEVESSRPTPRSGVYVDFENLVCGAGRGLPGRAKPVPYTTITRLCRDYGNAVICRAYADWANPQFGRYQQDLAMNGVARDPGGPFRRFQQERRQHPHGRRCDGNADHPSRGERVRVGRGRRRLHPAGAAATGVRQARSRCGHQANASLRLVSVCSEYKY